MIAKNGEHGGNYAEQSGLLNEALLAHLPSINRCSYDCLLTGATGHCCHLPIEPAVGCCLALAHGDVSGFCLQV